MGPLKASLRVETHCEYWILFPYLFLFLFIWNFQQDRSFSIRKLARLGCTGIERTTETNERKCCANKITLRASDDPKKHRYWYRLKIEMQDGGWLTIVREFQFSLKWRSKFQPVRVKGSGIDPSMARRCPPAMSFWPIMLKSSIWPIQERPSKIRIIITRKRER
jgi:hypothetical protein